jgi:hypothetical protein
MNVMKQIPKVLFFAGVGTVACWQAHISTPDLTPNAPFSARIIRTNQPKNPIDVDGAHILDTSSGSVYHVLQDHHAESLPHSISAVINTEKSTKIIYSLTNYTTGIQTLSFARNPKCPNAVIREGQGLAKALEILGVDASGANQTQSALNQSGDYVHSTMNPGGLNEVLNATPFVTNNPNSKFRIKPGFTIVHYFEYDCNNDNYKLKQGVVVIAEQDAAREMYRRR